MTTKKSNNIDQSKIVEFTGKIYGNPRFYDSNSSFGVVVISTQDDVPYAKKTLDYDINSNDTLETRTIVVAGKIPEPDMDAIYKIRGVHKFVEKFKQHQYEIISMISIAPKTIADCKIYLQSLCTEKQVEVMLDVYPNIVQDIIDGKDDYVDLGLLNGIGDITWEKIKDKVISNFAIADVINLLVPLGISFNKLKKLLNDEPNPQILKERLLRNPYKICEIKGISFSVADKIAIQLTPSLKESEERLIAFLRYYLEELANGTGDVYTFIENLRSEVIEIVPEVEKFLNQYIEKEKINPSLLIIDGNKIGLKYYYNMEENIFNVLNELNNSIPLEISEENILNGIEKSEMEQGFKFSEEQKGNLYNMTKNNLNILSGFGGCVDCDTEFFNGSEWKKISEYNKSDKVLQYDSFGNATLVYPQQYHKYNSEYLWHFKTKYGLDQCLSDEHNVPYITSKGNLYSKSFEEVRKDQMERNGFHGRFITSFQFGGSGLNYSDDMIRLLVAVIADGSFSYQLNETAKTYTKARFHIKKDHKKERLEKLINNTGLEFIKKESAAESYSDYYVMLPERIKIFDSRWYNCTNEQFRIIADEVLRWDGTTLDENRMGRFSANVKENADFVQFVFSAIGFRAKLSFNDRSGQEYLTAGKMYVRKSIDYNVGITDRTLLSLDRDMRDGRTFTQIDKYKTIDGYKYCFTVDTGMLVLRRNGKIFITGNSGKSSLARGLLNIYNDAGYNINICALSAAAAKRSTETTGYIGTTIHRLLAADHSGFRKNKYDKLSSNSIYLMDEASMTNDYVFNGFLSAIDTENSKVILMGDHFQLPPINAGQVFADIIVSKNNFQKNILTEVYRQSNNSGIFIDAMKQRKGIDPIDKKESRVVHGDNKDMIYIFSSDKEKLHSIALSSYQKAVAEDGLDNVILLSPRKSKVLNSTEQFNLEIQELLNSENMNICYERGKKKLLKNDKVFQNTNDTEKKIYNGYYGYISEIRKDGFSVDFGQDGFGEYTNSDYNDIELGYSSSCHRVQGGEYESVIIVLDMTSFMLLSSELLYTARTRGKKRVMILAEPQAYDMCLSESKNKRKTWLKGFLESKMGQEDDFDE